MSGGWTARPRPARTARSRRRASRPRQRSLAALEGRRLGARRTRFPAFLRVGRWPPRVGPGPAGTARQERRRPPVPGKWWVGGGERRGKSGKNRPVPRVGGTLLFETQGRWHAAAGEHHQIIESPVAGVVREARNGVEVTIEVAGAAIPGAIAAGEPSRGYLDVPRLTDGELWASALDVGRSGAIVVAGSRISAQAISRARAMSIRGLIAGSVGAGRAARPGGLRS